jgi:hypothetical protein
MTVTSSGDLSGVPTPNQFESKHQTRSNVKLIYRGQVFYATRRPEVAIEEVEQEGKTIELIYHGHTYQRKLPVPQPYQKPRALNWRWQTDTSKQ